ncbi:MAG: glycoside hydrolase [Cyclobacteriaceae bacterium]|nr:glycoside hydrolase [Cyclobacteriaceae bacterium]
MKFLGSLFLGLIFISNQSHSQVINLEGEWKFHVDDKSFWSVADFDDSKWGTIHVPSPWEEEGFNGYDGFAWYRKKFDGRKLDKADNYYLGLGFIDDCDEVYLNGKLVGFSGSMPPKFKTAYNTERKYVLPSDAINFNGENVIAIRIFDVVHGGGIIEGDIGIFRGESTKSLLVDLQGIWSFATSPSGEPIKKDATWDKLMVPQEWDQQGYARYDGFAWYKKTFTLPAVLPDEPLVLILGKIDDFDKTYFNGVFIGTTNDHRPYGESGSFDKRRVYLIPPDLLKKGGVNTIEVLVEDMGNIGGIHDGPVGITTRSKYNRYFEW